MRERTPCVYMLASQRMGTLYVGATSAPKQRIWQHRNGLLPGFTREHRVHLLVWFELHTTMESAIRREKLIKKWKRDWKIELIEHGNGAWRDLYDDICM
nr:GIY-YIG nuclease family protein [Chiayiivirga flava]